MTSEPRTTLYLLRHGATEASMARPPRFQGRRDDAPLARLGIRQAEATREFLAIRPIDHCYTSPLHRARETARIVASPHRLTPVVLDALIDCDLGRWEGLDWGSVREREPDLARAFHADPEQVGYPGGESLAEVRTRVTQVVDELLQEHEGESILVVGHPIVHRVYLASLLGMTLARARQLVLHSCGISIVVQEGGRASLATLNAAFHLQGVAA